MLPFALLFVVFVTTVPSLAKNIAPPAVAVIEPDCRGRHGPKNYPNPKQVNTYFQCVNGIPIKVWCPSRQNFNAAIGTCEPLQKIDEYPDVDRSKIRCKYEGQYICNPLNPRSFYQCSHNVPELHDCPAGLVFSERLNICVYWATRGGCGRPCPVNHSYNPFTEQCELDEGVDQCKERQLATGYYPDLTRNCEVYFRCQDNSQVGDPQRCPEGYRFDPRTMECEEDLSIVCAPCGTKVCP